jgi:hypothetical protein
MMPDVGDEDMVSVLEMSMTLVFDGDGDRGLNDAKDDVDA